MSRLSATRTILLMLPLGALSLGCEEERPAYPSPDTSWGAESDRIFYNARPRKRRVTASTFTYPSSAYETVPPGYYADDPSYDGALPESQGLPPGGSITPPPVAPPAGAPPYQPAPQPVTGDETEQAGKLRLARLKMRAAYENLKDAIRPAADYLRTESKRVYYESKYALNRAIEAFRRVHESEEVLDQVEEGKTPEIKPPARPKKVKP